MSTVALVVLLASNLWAREPKWIQPATTIKAPTTIASIPDRRFIFGRYAQRIQVWHAPTGMLVADVPGTGGAYNPRTDIAILGTQIWDLNDKRLILNTGLADDGVGAVGITRDSRYAIIVSTNIYIWDIQNRQLIKKARLKWTRPSFLALSEDLSYAAIGHGEIFDVINLSTGKVLKTGALAAVWPFKTRPAKGFSEFVDNKATEFTVLFEYGDFDKRTGPRSLWKLDWESGRVNIFASTPPRNLLAARPRDKKVDIVWAREADTRTTLIGHDANVGQVAFSPDRWTVATGDKAGKVLLWDAYSGELLYECIGGSEPVNSLGYSPDAQFLLVASTSTIRVYAVTP